MSVACENDKKNEGTNLVGYDAASFVFSRRFERSYCHYFQGQAVRSFETSGTVTPPTRRQNPQYLNLQLHRCDNLRCRQLVLFNQLTSTNRKRNFIFGTLLQPVVTLSD